MIDTYCRYKINKYYKKGNVHFSIGEFAAEYEFFKNPICSIGNARDKLQLCIKAFSKKFSSIIHLETPYILIDDDINEFVAYYTAMSDAIDFILQDAKKHIRLDQTQLSQIAPCQIDMLIIPKNTNMTPLYDDSDDEDENEDDWREKIDMIGNLEYRLEKDKELFTYEKIENVDVNGSDLSSLFYGLMLKALKEKRKQRLIIYIDRRDPSQTDQMKREYFETNYGQDDQDEDSKWNHSELHAKRKATTKTWKDTISIVRSTDTKYNELKDKYRGITSWWASYKCLLPRSIYCPLERRKYLRPYFGAGSPLNGYQFCLSWHIESINYVKTYWYHNGWMCRVFPMDAFKLWPMYFQKVRNGAREQMVKRHNKEKLKAMEQVIDPGFNKWYELTVGKDENGEYDLIRDEWIASQFIIDGFIRYNNKTWKLMIPSEINVIIARYRYI